MNTDITYCSKCKKRNDPKAYFLESCCECPKHPGNKNAQFPPNYEPLSDAAAKRFTELSGKQSATLHLCQLILNPERTYKQHQKSALRILIRKHHIRILRVPHHLHLIRRLKKDKRTCKQFKEAHIKVKHYDKTQTETQQKIIDRISQFKRTYGL